MPKIPPPKGTRDLYPLEAARRRWLLERWRKVSIRHGFEEVDGPTFETTDLYAVKSGEGILNELFQSYSGKDPKDIERIRAGDPAPFAMRPEFTPSLARMYAERARTLASPCKWFQIGPCFRAERPQRGRLREFLQWNLDIIGDDSPRADAELIACCVEFLIDVGFSSDSVSVRVSDRGAIYEWLREEKVPENQYETVLRVLDKRGDLPDHECQMLLEPSGLPLESVDGLLAGKDVLRSPSGEAIFGQDGETVWSAAPTRLPHLIQLVEERQLSDWVSVDFSIVRGLAYYTGTVFEVIADGERAIAGGGRYDNLIELFGGPPTPAAGFAMGDVVISLLLQDTLGANGKPLMPSDAELMDKIGARPDVFVISTHEGVDPIATRLLATLRREGLHARRSYKSTRNVGKLLKEANQQHARIAIIVESDAELSVKPLDGGQQVRLPLAAKDEFASVIQHVMDHVSDAPRVSEE